MVSSREAGGPRAIDRGYTGQLCSGMSLFRDVVEHREEVRDIDGEAVEEG
jgi:hypothetical protein